MKRAVLLLALLCTGFGPFGTPAAPVTRDARPEHAARAGHRLPPAQFFWSAFEFYHYVISPIDGPRCSHYPTCSLYAIESVQRDGVVLGLMRTIDRLLNDGRSSLLRSLPMIVVDGKLRFDDPVDAVVLPHPLPQEHGE